MTSPAAPRSAAILSREFAPERGSVARADDRHHLAAEKRDVPEHRRSAAAAHRVRPGPAEIPARRDAIMRPPSFASASSSRSIVVFVGNVEICRRRAAPCAAPHPAPQTPNRNARSSAANVTGPTLGVRASRNQARRSASESVRIGLTKIKVGNRGIGSAVHASSGILKMSQGNEFYVILSFGSFAVFGIALAIASWWERAKH